MQSAIKIIEQVDRYEARIYKLKLKYLQLSQKELDKVPAKYRGVFDKYKIDTDPMSWD